MGSVSVENFFLAMPSPLISIIDVQLYYISNIDIAKTLFADYINWSLSLTKQYIYIKMYLLILNELKILDKTTLSKEILDTITNVSYKTNMWYGRSR